MNRYKVSTDNYQKEYDAEDGSEYRLGWEILASWYAQENDGPRSFEGRIYVLTDGVKGPVRWHYLTPVFVHIDANGKVVA